MNGRSRRAALLAGLVITVAACQGPLSSQPGGRSSVTATPGPSARLLMADRKLYGGDYDGAEAGYLALARAQVPGAASHYSTLLAYEGRLKEAVAQASAGASGGRPDSDSLAGLTRALDWAEDIPGAARAGARAVTTQPVAPIAHVFYGEALADAGRFKEAERELRTAETLPGDAYVKAEVDREWANYYRGRQDTQSELNYLQISVKEQPTFPERQLELVRYDYGNQKSDAARSLTDRLLGHGTSTNYWLLVAAGGAAFSGGDFDRASALFASAARARPGGGQAALGQAEIAVAVKRDFNGAHGLLLDALKKDPSSADVYRYLRYLDLLVLKTDPDPELSPLVSQPPGDLAASRKAALDKVNGYRSALGVPPITEDAGVAEGAEAHAYYYLFNLGRPQLQGLGIHTEDQSLPGFSGANSLLRDRHFGYGGSRGAEVIDHVFTPEGSVQVWMDSVYHRYPLLARETAVAGYGEASLGVASISVLDFGVGEPGAGEPTVYPQPDQVDVPGYFNGGEVPDPVPEGTSYPVGYPVTLQFGAAQSLTVTTGRLLSSDGKEVPSFTLQPGKTGLGPSEWALLAQQPLAAGARYTAEVAGKVDGQDFSKRWSFTIASH